MGSGVLIMSEKSQEYVRYIGTKIDAEIMRLVKGAAGLEGKTVQEWLSDVANEAAAKRVKQSPIKRKPAPPHPKRNPKKS